MSIDLPQTVRIGPHDYAVNPPGWRLADGLFGHHDGSALEIVVDPDIPPMQQAETWIHEVLHGLWDVANLSDIDGLVEERVVGGLARAMLSFMRDNPNGLDAVWEAIGTCRRNELAGRLRTGGQFS